MIKYQCGNCGGEEFEIYGNDNTLPTKIKVKCMECTAYTIIKVPHNPRMNLHMGKQSLGRLKIQTN